MIFKVVSAIGAMVVLATASPAMAGWKNVQWGMSKATIQKLYPQSDLGTSVTSDDTMLSIKDVDYGDMQWERVDFVFNSAGRLWRVTLVSHQDRYPYVKKQLASQFGAPVTETGNTAQFLDRKRNNSIEVWYDRDFGLRVNYSKPASF